MLSMSNVTSVEAAGAYYAEDNYYSEGENQERSAWAGKGAEQLGLEGIVDTASFTEVLSGKVGDQQLGRVSGMDEEGNPVREHRPGYDITLSAPKSVSILAEVGGAADVRAAHEAATTKVLDFIEKHLVGARVTKNGETEFVQTDNLIAGRFHHTTSRALDPQTHTHLVIANATQTEDGVWRSLSNEKLYKAQKLLGGIYDSELAANLRGLGYRLENGPDGRWEIAGISREQIEHFSQRSKDIEDRLAAFGLTRKTATAAQREDAALRTRESKAGVDHHELREHWQARAAAVGISFEQVEVDRGINAARKIEPEFTQEKAGDAVGFALAHLTERESVVPRDMVLEAALDHAMKDTPWAGVRLDHVTQALNEKLQSEVALPAKDQHVTTKDALEREQLMMASLEAGRGVVAPIADADKVARAIEQFELAKSQAFNVDFSLTQGQADAARLVLGSNDRFMALQGYAGVGKTTMMELVNQVAVDAGYTVRGMASSGEAAIQLQKEAGIESSTLARFLLDEGRRAEEVTKPRKVELVGAIDLAGTDIRTLKVTIPPAAAAQGQAAAAPRKELWVVDEASLAGQREVTSLMAMAERADARVVLVGDKLQLNAVEAGKPFELLQKAGIASAEMSEISRQRVQDLQQAVAAAVQRDNVAALKRLEERVVENPNKAQLLQRVVNDLLAKHGPERPGALVIAPLNADRQAINDMMRTALKAAGSIKEDKLQREVLVKSGLTEEQRSWAGYYSQSMAVRFGSNLNRLGVARGDYGRVVDVDHDKKLVKLQMEDGKIVQWSPAKNSRVEVYEVEKRSLAVGDELRFTRPDKDLGIVNGTHAKVVGVDGERIRLSTASGELQLQAKGLQHSHLEYAYSMTVYSSQGKTVNDVSFLITKESGQAMGERSFYVGITRERDDLTIYTDSKSKAMELVQRAQAKSSAIEGVDESGAAAKGKGAGRAVAPGAGAGLDL